MGEEDLCNPTPVALAALICAKSHVFSVLENDVAAMIESLAT
jgi:hypothetical protein